MRHECKRKEEEGWWTDCQDREPCDTVNNLRSRSGKSTNCHSLTCSIEMLELPPTHLPTPPLKDRPFMPLQSIHHRNLHTLCTTKHHKEQRTQAPAQTNAKKNSLSKDLKRKGPEQPKTNQRPQKPGSMRSRAATHRPGTSPSPRSPARRRAP